MSKEYRKCPFCSEPGISIAEVYPHGTSCESCGKHVEVSITAITLSIAAMLVIMFVDFQFYDSGLGLFVAILMVFFGAFYQKVYALYVPLVVIDD